MDLHEWVFKLSSWHEAHGGESGEGDENPSNAVIKEAQEGTGAVVMGRNMFGPIRGQWTEPAWTGWWGDEPPFHTPVFVLTHHERDTPEEGDERREPGDFNSEGLYQDEFDAGRAQDLKDRLAARRARRGAPGRRHLRPLDPQRRADSRRAASRPTRPPS